MHIYIYMFQATVLFLDVVDFAKACMQFSCSESAAWMTAIHHVIPALHNIII
jgi:hypothetical protein